MKAVVFVPGPRGASVEVRELPVPVPGPGEVLVRVMAAGLNRGELAVREKLVSGPPVPNGIEFAGEVAALGPGATGVAVGDRVMGHWRAGQAEYVAADARLLVPVPPSLGWIEAAAWLNVFTTAHDAIVTNGRLRAGEAVLVNAVSSGIGVAAVQIARLMGAGCVLASSRSAAKLARLREELGFDVAVDASDPGWPAAVRGATGGRGVDLVVDSVGAPALAGNLAAAALGARIVSVGRVGGDVAPIDLDLLAFKRVALLGVTFRTRTLEQRADCVRRCRDDLWPALAQGRFRILVHRTYAIDEIADAHAAMARDEHVGKLVLRIAA